MEHIALIKQIEDHGAILFNEGRWDMTNKVSMQITAAEENCSTLESICDRALQDI